MPQSLKTLNSPDAPPAFKRSRGVTALAIVAVIIVGLGSRRFPGVIPPWLAKSAGDALYAVAAYLGIALLFPALPIARTAVAALIYSYGIEVSQLYHAPWFEAIRHTKLGGLILGYGFAWPDIAYYTVGVGGVALCERWLARRRRRRSA